MKSFTLFLIATATMLGSAHPSNAQSQPTSEFDEAAIRAIQDGRAMPSGFQSTAEQFEASSDPVAKAAKYEQLVVTGSEGLLNAVWPEPAGGWKLVEFPAGNNLTLDEVRNQQSGKVYYTKIIAQNEAAAVRLRAAQALILNAALEGQQWGEKLLLDIAQRPDSNMKRLAYWFMRDFAQDWNTRESETGPVAPWPVNWSAWQAAYNAANPLGKAIILRNITTLAVRRNEVATAAAINLAALSGTDRELKAIALAFGDAALGSAVTAKWAEIANNASDPQLQALAQEVRTKAGITD
jgi:hypothetical protein